MAFVFLGLLAAAVLFVAYSLYSDVEASGATTTFLPYLLLFVALLTALGFEFVNGFHDTANAVATVIYTHAMPASLAGSLAKVPTEAVGNIRNDMYLTDEALRLLMKDKEADLSTADIATSNAYKQSLDSATKFIPTWVKVAVAIALGLGTMVGW